MGRGGAARRPGRRDLRQRCAGQGRGLRHGLHPSLSQERLELLAAQKQFLYAHGFLAGDFDLDSWVAAEPLARARELVEAEKAAA